MEKKFINYEQAVYLKELGFDEPCFGRYCIKTIFEEPTGEILLQNIDCKIYESRFLIKSPLYQQAFDFFEEKYNLSGETQKQAPYEKVTNPYWWYTIQDVRGNDLSNWQDRFGEILNKSHQDKKEKYIDDDEFVKFLYNDKFAFKTRLEAKIECLNRLIEIVKQSK